ncbi:MAG: hypothetical protein WCG27_04965 [Pseudomonadota bacterium]
MFSFKNVIVGLSLMAISSLSWAALNDQDVEKNMDGLKRADQVTFTLTNFNTQVESFNRNSTPVVKIFLAAVPQKGRQPIEVASYKLKNKDYNYVGNNSQFNIIKDAIRIAIPGEKIYQALDKINVDYPNGEKALWIANITLNQKIYEYVDGIRGPGGMTLHSTAYTNDVNFALTADNNYRKSIEKNANNSK